MTDPRHQMVDPVQINDFGDLPVAPMSNTRVEALTRFLLDELPAGVEPLAPVTSSRDSDDARRRVVSQQVNRKRGPGAGDGRGSHKAWFAIAASFLAVILVAGIAVGVWELAGGQQQPISTITDDGMGEAGDTNGGPKALMGGVDPSVITDAMAKTRNAQSYVSVEDLLLDSASLTDGQADCYTQVVDRSHQYQASAEGQPFENVTGCTNAAAGGGVYFVYRDGRAYDFSRVNSGEQASPHIVEVPFATFSQGSDSGPFFSAFDPPGSMTVSSFDSHTYGIGDMFDEKVERDRLESWVDVLSPTQLQREFDTYSVSSKAQLIDKVIAQKRSAPTSVDWIAVLDDAGRMTFLGHLTSAAEPGHFPAGDPSTWTYSHTDTISCLDDAVPHVDPPVGTWTQWQSRPADATASTWEEYLAALPS